MFIVNFFRGAMEWLGFFQKSANIVFLGLDNAGKTTMLYMLQSDRFTQTDSTLHPHQAEVTIGNIRFNTYDLGGHNQARKTWADYCGTLDGIIFMIDAAQHDRLKSPKLNSISSCKCQNYRTCHLSSSAIKSTKRKLSRRKSSVMSWVFPFIKLMEKTPIMLIQEPAL